MIHADELQNLPGQMQFSMTLVETAHMPLDPSKAIAARPGAGRPGELILTGSQLLAAFLSVLSTVSLVLWAVIKLWIFEP